MHTNTHMYSVQGKDPVDVICEREQQRILRSGVSRARGTPHSANPERHPRPLPLICRVGPLPSTNTTCSRNQSEKPRGHQ
ncbi:hypothetical protein BHE74_00059828 [Ensete ventricosum]|nr:hypothetical protein BHE74_00059828 [Ensete ventricosum]